VFQETFVLQHPFNCWPIHLVKTPELPSPKTSCWKAVGNEVSNSGWPHWGGAGLRPQRLTGHIPDSLSSIAAGEHSQPSSAPSDRRTATPLKRQLIKVSYAPSEESRCVSLFALMGSNLLIGRNVMPLATVRASPIRQAKLPRRSRRVPRLLPEWRQIEIRSTILRVTRRCRRS
jgi:hypothetical protein